MLKTAIIVCAISLAATGSLHAGATIEVEKFSKADLLTALQTASDDTVIEFQGQSKTKAPWRSEFQAAQKRALEKQKEAAAAAKGQVRRCRKGAAGSARCSHYHAKRGDREGIRGTQFAVNSPKGRRCPSRPD